MWLPFNPANDSAVWFSKVQNSDSVTIEINLHQITFCLNESVMVSCHQLFKCYNRIDIYFLVNNVYNHSFLS